MWSKGFQHLSVGLRLRDDTGRGLVRVGTLISAGINRSYDVEVRLPGDDRRICVAYGL